MQPADDAASFEQKWHARWPEWGLAMAFVPTGQRARASAWFALLQELGDAALAGEDAVPGLAKLAWWQEELLGWSKGARRHPLGRVLQPVPAPWPVLAQALPVLQAQRRRPGEPAHAAAERDDFADAVLRCEAALFDLAAGDGAALVAMRDALARERALLYPQAVAATDAAGAPAAGLLSRPRAIHAALVAGRARGGGVPLPPLRALVAAWAGARAGGRVR